jgi:hypothetical protein
MDVPESFNSMIYATLQPTTFANLVENYTMLQQRGDIHPLLLQALQRVILNQQPTPQGSVVYTDDWAPIEWITNNMVLNFVLFGGIEDLE